MRKKDVRFSIAAKLFKAGHINDLDDLFEVIPYSVVAGQLGINNTRMKDMHQIPEKWLLLEIYLLSYYLEIDFRETVNIVVNQCEKKKTERSSSEAS